MAFLTREGIMLCYPAEDKHIIKLGDSCLSQPKLNGERCRVEWFRHHPVLLSSYGNHFQFCTRIERDLLEMRDKHLSGLELPFDGEIYVHGWDRERIHSAVSRKKKYNPDVEQLKLHVFDIQDLHLKQFQRTYTLENHRPLFAHFESLELVENKIILTRDWLDHCQTHIENGYEGIILRHLGGSYELKRSTSILKFKPTAHDDYLIVGYNQEVDISGNLKDSLGSFIVTSDEGTRFSVGTGPALTRAERERLWGIRDSLVSQGRYLRVKHEAGLTNGGIPIATVAVEVI